MPERPPADGSGAARAKLVAKLEKLDVRQQGLAEAAARGVAFHHGGACSMTARVGIGLRLGVGLEETVKVSSRFRVEIRA